LFRGIRIEPIHLSTSKSQMDEKQETSLAFFHFHTQNHTLCVLLKIIGW
jgi:hypothetical protein